MTGMWKQIGTVLFAALVAVGLTFGASQALSVDPVTAAAAQVGKDDYCGDNPGEYDSGLCEAAGEDPDCTAKCEDEHGTFGSCILTTYDGWCCMCAV